MIRKLIKPSGVNNLIVAILLSGCSLPFGSGYGENGESEQVFAQHVEKVFRLQNSMTSKLMMLMESDGIKNPDALLQAERRMQEMCKPLNDYVSRDIDGLSTGLFLRRRVEKSTEACERAAREVELLLAGS